jgi:hypothetical protein
MLPFGDSWRALFHVTEDAAKLPSVKLLNADEVQRISMMDAERTFKGDAQKAKLRSLTDRFMKDFGDYHQGLSYVASMILLVVDDLDEVYSIVHQLASNNKWMLDIWKAEATENASDGYAVLEILAKHMPSVATKIQSVGAVPETWFQKYGTGFGLHVLPLEAAFALADGIFVHGRKMLYKFTLALLHTLAERIMAAKDVTSVFPLLMLDKPMFDHGKVNVAECNAMVEAARKHCEAAEKKDKAAAETEKKSDDLLTAMMDAVDEMAWDKQRSAAYDKYLRARVERARAMAQKAAEEEEDEESDGMSDMSSDSEDEEERLARLMGNTKL